MVKVLVQLFQQQPVLENSLHWFDELRTERKRVAQNMLTVLQEDSTYRVMLIDVIFVIRNYLPPETP